VLGVPQIICADQFYVVVMGLQDAFNYVLQNPLVTGTVGYVKAVVCSYTLLCLPFVNLA
jgi:hypothetical protein